MRRSILILAACAVPSVALGQPYVSAELGYANAEFPLGAPYNGVIDDRAATYGVDLGLGFGPLFGIELGVNRYGDFDGTATPCPAGGTCTLAIRGVSGNDMTTYQLALVPRFTIGDLRMFAKAGYYRAEIDTNIGLPDNDFSEDGLLVGIGVRWLFKDPWSVSLEATRFGDDVSQLTVGFGFGPRIFAR